MELGSFKKLYGYLYRSYTKSIITYLEDNYSDYFTDSEISIGIFQYHPFDGCFYYAPTIKELFVMPDEVSESIFPSTKSELWNYELMIVLGKLLSLEQVEKTIKDVFSENDKLQEKGGSTYAITSNNYSEFKHKWLSWYENHISDLESLNNTSHHLCHQLFYFCNFLVTIIPRRPYSNPSKQEISHSETIYRSLIYNTQKQVQKILDPRYDIAFAELRGFETFWAPEPESNYPEGLLLYILEISFKQPFNTKTKIDLISKILKREKYENKFLINAIGIPLTHNGEFLGISYIAWEATKTLDETVQKEITDNLKKLIKNSRISSFIYKARYSSSKLFLQKSIDNKESNLNILRRIHQSSIHFSSAFISLLFINDKCHCIHKKKNGIIYDSFEKELALKFDHFKNELFQLNEAKEFSEEVTWLDVNKSIINKDRPATDRVEEIENYKIWKGYNEIELFNRKLRKILNLKIHETSFFSITNASIHYLEIGDSIGYMVFLGSNYRLVHGYNFAGASLVKQSYAKELHNNLVDLSDYIFLYKRLYNEKTLFSDWVKKGLIHKFKSYIATKIKRSLSSNLNDAAKIKKAKDNCDLIVIQMTKYLKAYTPSKTSKILMARDLAKGWDEIIKRYKNYSEVNISKVSSIGSIEYLKFQADIISLEMIFEEFIENAINYSGIINSEPISLNLKIENKSNSLQVMLINTGSIIEESQRIHIGKYPISDSLSTGYGYFINEVLLERMNALSMGDSTHFVIEYDDLTPAFKLIFNLKKI